MSRGLINKLFNDVQQLLHMVIPVILQNVILCRYPIMLVSHARGMLHRWRRRCRQHHSCKRTFRARNRLPTSSRFQRLLRCQNLQHAGLNDPDHSQWQQPPVLGRVVWDDWRRVVLAHLSWHERVLGHAVGRMPLQRHCLIFCHTRKCTQEAHVSTRDRESHKGACGGPGLNGIGQYRTSGRASCVAFAPAPDRGPPPTHT